jgi:transposase
MPKRIQVVAHLSVEEVGTRFRQSSAAKSRAHWQVIWLLLQGRPSGEVALLCGYSVAWVRALVGRYNAQGPESLGDGRRGHSGAKPLVDVGLRQELEAVLGGAVPTELGGGLWNGVKVAAWLEGKLGHKVYRQRGQEMLRALGYSPLVPRPCHKSADKNAQEAFKKSWHKP